MDAGKIAGQVLEWYRLDKESMGPWLEKMQRGIDLANMLKEHKTTPFEGAANVKYPLVAQAALQFNARAYPAIVQDGEIVKPKIWGKDPMGIKAARGGRVASHMSWQLQEQIEGWEESTDQLLLQLSIVGQLYRKWWFDPVKGSCCRAVDAGRFIVNEKVRSFYDAPRCAEEIDLYPSDIKTRIRTGRFADFEWDEDPQDKDGPQLLVEMHCRLDLDEDGYGEPYIATVHVDREELVRLVADFTLEDVTFDDPQMPTRVVAIQRSSYFTGFKFMPSMDGGINGTGLGILLGDTSDTVDTLINMLLDSGKMNALGGGFIGSEFRIKGGHNGFRPGEWKTANVPGADIRSSLVPLTFPQPSDVLFQLLGLLIDAGKQLSSTQDIMVGDTGGKAMQPTTVLALIEQGMNVFTASYKRIFNSLKQEFKLLARINAQNVSPEEYNMFLNDFDDQGQPVFHDPQADYNMSDMAIVPVADPRSVTKMQEMAKAELLNGLAQGGMVDPVVASRRIMEAAGIPDVEEVLPKPNPMVQQMEMMQMEIGMQMMQADLAQKMVDIDLTIAKVAVQEASAMEKLATLEIEARAVEIEAVKAKFQGMKMILEERKNAIETVLRTGMGRVEGKSGNGGASGSGQGGVSEAQIRSAMALLEGGTPPGSGAAGAAPI